MRKFCFKVFAISLPMVMLLVGVNYFGDAAKLFDSKYEDTMADIIKQGSHVTNVSNYDERVFQEKLIYNLESSPDIVVIGSSRTMLIHSGLFPNSSLQNSSVSVAGIEDIVSIYQVYKETDKLPQRVILGIDPWTFNDAKNDVKWMSLEFYYNKFHGDSLSVPTHSLSFYKYSQLFSFTYFQASIKKLNKRVKVQSNPEPAVEKYNTNMTKLSDGSLAYGSEHRNQSQEEIDIKIENYIEGMMHHVDRFDKISERKWQDFEKLVLDLEGNDIQIELFVSPYAPFVYQYVSENYPIVPRVETVIKQFAADKGIKVYGSFDPNELGFSKELFYDGVHCKEEGLERILEE